MLLSRLGLVLLLASAGCDAARDEAPEAAEISTRSDSLLPVGAPSVYDSTAPDPTTTEAEGVMGGGELATTGGGGEAIPDELRPPPPPPAEGSRQTPGSVPAGDAQAILVRAERAYDGVRSMRASFIQDLTVPLLNSSQRSRGEMFHRKPDRFLMRFTDPAGDVVVADGRYVWLYYPSSDPKQVIRASVGDAGRLDLQREFLSNPTERFEATLDGTESVDGRSASALTLVPRGPSPYRKVRIWVDDRDALVRRFEITENNEAVRRVELRALQSNVTLPDSLFSFTPPAGTQVFEQ